jgi:hypothetical protein
VHRLPDNLITAAFPERSGNLISRILGIPHRAAVYQRRFTLLKGKSLNDIRDDDFDESCTTLPLPIAAEPGTGTGRARVSHELPADYRGQSDAELTL